MKDATFICLASIDDVTYSWHRVGSDLPSMSSGQHSNSFTIHKATPPDEGKYYCVATKSGIIVESNNASVVVDGKHAYTYTVKSLLWDTFI